ncbi:hypothetical protein VTK26DRAFT_5183 [Humicola hyalothermophila]
MRLDWLLLIGAAALAVASPPEIEEEEEEEEEAPREPTFFNGKKVPPLLELTQNNWETERKASKYLLVKHYSPWCGHCIDFAPTYQTLYEFYYTSTPVGDAPKDADFTSFYDFRFGDINCVAYNDLCTAHQVKSYPFTVLYEDGEPIVTFRGTKSIEVLSTGLEEVLEKAKPGTRPKKLQLPQPGDKSTPEKKEDSSDAAVARDDTENADAKQTATGTNDAKATAETKPASKEYHPPEFNPPPQKKKQRSAPNPQGVSVPLTAEEFSTLVTATEDPWFIKFYAPWCHHCMALKPVWEQLGKRMKNRLHIGEVNCEEEARLCKEVGVRGYPTITFFQDGQRAEYNGLRGLGDFLQFAEKAIDLANGVQDVDAESFKALEEKEEVIFLYFYDHATTSEDFEAIERLPIELIGRAKLVRTRDPKLYERFKISTWPRLLVSREGRPTYYTPLTPPEMRDTKLLLDWMKSVWLPLVPELTAANAREIMDGKMVVLGILNRENDDSYKRAIREMKSAANEWMDRQIQLFQLERQELRNAKQLRIEEAEDRGDERALRNAKNIKINMDRSDRKEVTFAWVDGVFWQRWIRTTYGIDASRDGERVIINDEDNRRYWDQTSTGNPIVPSRTSILETLNKVTANPPQLKPKFTISALHKVFFDIRVAFRDHPVLSTGCVLGIAFGCLSWFRSRTRRGRGAGVGHFKLEDAMRDLKGPLLGGPGMNGGSKVD